MLSSIHFHSLLSILLLTLATSNVVSQPSNENTKSSESSPQLGLPKSSESPTIHRLPNTDSTDRIAIHNAHLTTQNTTYIIEPQTLTIHDKTSGYPSIKPYQLIVEMNILTYLEQTEFVIFGINEDSAISYHPNTDSYNGTYLDSRSYYLQKQQYRIAIDMNASIDSADSLYRLPSHSTFYLTIYIKDDTSNTVRDLLYSLNIQIIDSSNSKKEKPCPFDCLNRGQCNHFTGECECFNGFVDLDCSKSSSLLLPYSTTPHTNVDIEQTLVEWTIQVDSNHSSALFYHLPQSADIQGYLYVSIKRMRENEYQISQDNPKNKLEIFYTPETKQFSGLGVADKGFAKVSKSIHFEDLTSATPIDFYLDSFTGSSSSIRSTNSEQQSPDVLSDSSQLLLLFGIRSTPIESEYSSSNNNNKKTGYSSTLAKEQEQQELFQIKLFFMSEINHESRQNGIVALIKKNMILLIAVAFLLVFFVLLLIAIQRLRRSTRQLLAEHQEIIASKEEKKAKFELDIKTILEKIKEFSFEEIQTNRHWIKLVKESEETASEPACSVCLCEFEIGDKIKVTHCPHFFHHDCLFEWLKKQKNCPHCRNPFTLEALEEVPQSPSMKTETKPSFTVPSPQKKIKQKKQGYIEQIDESVFNNSSANISNINNLSLMPENQQQYSIMNYGDTPLAYRNNESVVDPEKVQKNSILSFENKAAASQFNPYAFIQRSNSLNQDITPQLSCSQPIAQPASPSKQLQ